MNKEEESENPLQELSIGMEAEPVEFNNFKIKDDFVQYRDLCREFFCLRKDHEALKKKFSDYLEGQQACCVVK